MRARPEGIVTFLLTDVVGSTRTWDREPSDAVRRSIERMYELVHDAVEAVGGFRPAEQGEGDSVVAAFRTPGAAVEAALEAQRSLLAWTWPTSEPVRVRMALHTGEAILRDERDYLGPAIIRTARLRALAHGGQILMSAATRQLLGDDLPDGASVRDLGVHSLKDLSVAEHVFQLLHADLPDEFPALLGGHRVRGDVPLELAPLIGRSEEIAQLRDLLVRSRLVTVTGPGGAGKTRLALRVAADLADDFPEGAWCCDLSPIGDAGLVGETIARVLGVVPGASGIESALQAHVGDGRVLLVLDNGEHVADALADTVVALLRACPRLVVLVTSRVILDVHGEITWQVPPLSLPTDSEPDELESSDAVQLFVARAAAARTGFVVTSANAPAIAAIVRRLDGLPLAIELAAARVRTLNVDRIASGLDDALGFLGSGSARRGARQRTLEASVRWSHELLDDAERVALRRLSVFAGAASLDTIEAVLADELLPLAAVLPAVERLVEHSLLVPVDAADGLRFRLLELIRQFARTELAQAGEEAELAARHGRHHLAVIAGAEADVERDAVAAHELAAVLDDIRAALRWAEIDDVHEFGLAVFRLRGVWLNHPGLTMVGLELCEHAATCVADIDARLHARLLACQAHLMIFVSRPGTLDTARRARAIADEIGGDAWTAGRSWYVETVVMITARAFGEADLAARASLDAARAAGDDYGANHARFGLISLHVAVGLGDATVVDDLVSLPATATLEAVGRSAASATRFDTLDAVRWAERAVQASDHGLVRHAVAAMALFCHTQMALRCGAQPELGRLQQAAERYDRLGEVYARNTVLDALGLAHATRGPEGWDDAIGALRGSRPSNTGQAGFDQLLLVPMLLARDDVVGATAERDSIAALAAHVPESRLIVLRSHLVQAYLCEALGDAAGAVAAAFAALRIAHDDQQRYDRVHALETLARLAPAVGASELAPVLLDAALAERRATNYRYALVWPPVDIDRVPQLTDVAHVVERAQQLASITSTGSAPV